MKVYKIPNLELDIRNCSIREEEVKVKSTYRLSYTVRPGLQKGKSKKSRGTAQ